MDDEDKNKTGDEKKIAEPVKHKSNPRRDYEQAVIEGHEVKRLKQAAKNREVAEAKKAAGLVTKSVTIRKEHVEFFNETIKPLIKSCFIDPEKVAESEHARKVLAAAWASINDVIQKTRAGAVMPTVQTNTIQGQVPGIAGGACDDKDVRHSPD